MRSLLECLPVIDGEDARRTPPEPACFCPCQRLSPDED
jgi:hypothetical protein